MIKENKYRTTSEEVCLLEHLLSIELRKNYFSEQMINQKRNNSQTEMIIWMLEELHLKVIQKLLLLKEVELKIEKHGQC
jgi:hypothetical protein